MKIFLDTADVEAVRKAQATGLLDGVTTNPSKIAETGRNFEEVVAEICKICPGPVSAEAMADTTKDLVKEAERLAKIAPNVVVKIPMTVDGLTAAGILEKEKNIRVNVTMVFSSTQTLMAMKTGASYVSIVLSRLDAVGNESDIIVEDAVALKQNYGFKSEVLAASLKTQNHVLVCQRAGVDVITIPDTLFFQMFKHPLTDIGLAEFAEVWKTVSK
jgi:transaldolase